jgi:S1-C subfamily serine protease
VEKATVLVVTESGFGSGFFIAPNLILTNRHVAERKNSVCLVVNKALGKPVEAVVAAATPTKGDGDYAVLRLKNSYNIRPLKFSIRARRSDRVAAWGYPGFFLEKLDPNYIPEVVYSSGEINVIYDSPVPLIAHTATISQGNSGGPLLNDRGYVVGVNTLLLRDDPRRSYRQVFLAFEASDIIAFLRQNNLQYEVAE